MSEAVKSKKLTKKELEALLSKKEEEIRSLQQEEEGYIDKWKRALAELENYRKRKEKEEENIRKYAQENILYELLGIVDNFERALVHINKTDSIDTLKQGIEMIYQQFKALLKQHKVERIEALGKEFDPRYHEAIDVIGKEEQKDHSFMVTEEILPGYMLHDRLLRPAKVKVSGKGTETEKTKGGKR